MRYLKTGRRQRGLSLFWCVVVFVAVSLVMMTGLMSFRYNRNLFVEGWAIVQGRWSVLIEQAPAALAPGPSSAPDARAAAAAPSGEVRKCMVDGKVLYSNVECAGKQGSRKVEVGSALATPAPPAAAEPRK